MSKPRHSNQPRVSVQVTDTSAVRPKPERVEFIITAPKGPIITGVKK